MKLSTVLENSIKGMGIESGSLENINESTTSADIATFASQIGALIKKKYKTSLAYELCDVQPLNTPVGKVFILDKELQDEVTNKWKFTVKQTTVEAATKTANTGFTNEAWQDLNAMFGEDANDTCANVLAKVSASSETTDLLALLNDNAVSLGNIAASSYEDIHTYVGTAISKINQKTFRTMEAFALVPAKMAGQYIIDPNYFVTDSLETTSQYLQYKFAKTKIYVNPDTEDMNIYVGVNGREPGTSSVIFSPYQYTVSPAIDPDTGINYLYVFNRYGITMNPLHTEDDPMLYKFTFTLPFES